MLAGNTGVYGSNNAFYPDYINGDYYQGDNGNNTAGPFTFPYDSSQSYSVYLEVPSSPTSGYVEDYWDNGGQHPTGCNPDCTTATAPGFFWGDEFEYDQYNPGNQYGNSPWVGVTGTNGPNGLNYNGSLYDSFQGDCYYPFACKCTNLNTGWGDYCGTMWIPSSTIVTETYTGGEDFYSADNAASTPQTYYFWRSLVGTIGATSAGAGGSPCTKNSDCTYNNCSSSGICGGIGATCDNNHGATPNPECQSTICNTYTNTCSSGETGLDTCTKGSDCQDDFCDTKNSVCSDGSAGSVCAQNADCLYANCATDGICGDIGSYCDDNNGTGPNPECALGYCDSKNSVCSTGIAAMGCTQNSDCVNGNCSAGDVCGGGGSPCTLNGQCMATCNNYISSSATYNSAPGTCLGAPYSACTQNSDCVTNDCDPISHLCLGWQPTFQPYMITYPYSFQYSVDSATATSEYGGAQYCAFLAADGNTELNYAQDYWRIPTSSELGSGLNKQLSGATNQTPCETGFCPDGAIFVVSQNPQVWEYPRIYLTSSAYGGTYYDGECDNTIGGPSMVMDFGINQGIGYPFSIRCIANKSNGKVCSTNADCPYSNCNNEAGTPGGMQPDWICGDLGSTCDDNNGTNPNPECLSGYCDSYDHVCSAGALMQSGCKIGADCSTGYCDTLNHVCSDGLSDLEYPDIFVYGRFLQGVESCAAAVDCVSGYCSSQLYSCSGNQDCINVDLGVCNPGKCSIPINYCSTCASNSNCVSGKVCDPLDHYCDSTGLTSCNDNNGTNPNPECSSGYCNSFAGTCSSGLGGQGCTQNSDCYSGQCNTTTHTCHGFQPSSVVQLSLSAATTYCANLKADGTTEASSSQNIWRLPAEGELYSALASQSLQSTYFEFGGFNADVPYVSSTADPNGGQYFSRF